MTRTATSKLDTIFDRIRAELDIRARFPEETLREAELVVGRDPAADPSRVDRTGLAMVTIDPPGSRDLDQAVHAERRGDGYRVHYAIADVGFFVDRGSDIEAEAWRRGVTMYAPDENQPLYPPELSENGASLLPGEERPAVLFTFKLDSGAELTAFQVERALVRSRAQLTYAQLLRWGTEPEPEMPGGETLPLLAEIGPKRLQLEIERGGVSLPLRAQHVQRVAARRLGYEVVYEDPNPAENWNAQISLLTGHAAALRMLEARIGLLRTMTDADEGDVRRFRLAAKGLGYRWPEWQSYREFIHGLDLNRPHIEALVWQARRLMRAAGYTAFAGELPPEPIHAALALEYAHCTAPLRRLADRYVLDLLISLAAGEQPDEPQIATLRKLPGVMAGATRKERELERRVVSVAEAWVLRDSVGSTFDALVLSAAGGRVEFQIEDPPVRARIDAPDGHPAVHGGTHLRLRLAEADLDAGTLRFELDQ